MRTECGVLASGCSMLFCLVSEFARAATHDKVEDLVAEVGVEEEVAGRQKERVRAADQLRARSR